MDNDEVLRLLGRIERADENAFRELYRAFSRKLYAYVLRQLGNPAQAEEIVSDTLYEVWRQPARFRGDSQFSTWLIGIARNKVLMAFRGRKPDAIHEDIDAVAETVAADEPSPFELLAGQQRGEMSDASGCDLALRPVGLGHFDRVRHLQVPVKIVESEDLHLDGSARLDRSGRRDLRRACGNGEGRERGGKLADHLLGAGSANKALR